MQKQVQTPLGEVTVSTPRDRNSSFDPQFIKKRGTAIYVLICVRETRK